MLAHSLEKWEHDKMMLIHLKASTETHTLFS